MAGTLGSQVMKSWWEHPRYYRTTDSITPQRSLSAVDSYEPYLHASTPLVCSALSMPNTKHIYLFLCCEMTKDCSESQLWRKYIYIRQHYHIIWQRSMRNQNLNGVYLTVHYAKKTCSLGAFSGGFELGVKWAHTGMNSDAWNGGQVVAKGMFMSCTAYHYTWRVPHWIFGAVLYRLTMFPSSHTYAYVLKLDGNSTLWMQSRHLISIN